MDDKNKKPAERGYDGVIYTPSSAATQGSYGTRGVVKKPAATTRKTGVKRKKRKHKSQLGVFLAATLFTGVVVCIIIFAMVFNSVIGETGATKGAADNSNVNLSSSPTIETPIASLPVSSEKTSTLTGIVKSIGTNGQLNVYDFNTGKSLNFIADNLSLLKNKYGEPIVFAEISIGDIVDVEYLDNSIKELFFSRQATEYKNISNVKIDTVEQIIEIGNDSFSFNDQLITYNKGETLDLSAIKPLDVLTVKFYKNIVWYMELNKGHGYIEFDGIDFIKDGVVEIDNNIIKSLDDFERLEILEGSHKVVVKGANITPISKEIYIERNAVAAIDLSELELLTGQLVLKVNQTDYSLTINGEEIDLTKPIELNYGEYAVTVEKDGYTPWEGSVEIKDRSNQLIVELTEKIQFCKFTVYSDPAGAEIYIDNFFIGISPCTQNIEYGTHSITYKKDGYKTINFDITLNTPEDSKWFWLQEESPFMPY